MRDILIRRFWRLLQLAKRLLCPTYLETDLSGLAKEIAPSLPNPALERMSEAKGSADTACNRTTHARHRRIAVVRSSSEDH